APGGFGFRQQRRGFVRDHQVRIQQPFDQQAEVTELRRHPRPPSEGFPAVALGPGTHEVGGRWAVGSGLLLPKASETVWKVRLGCGWLRATGPSSGGEAQPCFEVEPLPPPRPRRSRSASGLRGTFHTVSNARRTHRHSLPWAAAWADRQENRGQATNPGTPP